MKILTCAPLPPPHGGIANWYALLCAEAARRQVTFLNIDTSPKKSIDGRTLFYRVVVQGFRMLSQRREMKRLIRQNPDVTAAHITTSGELAVVRDILLLSLLKKKGIRAVYHLHFGTVPAMFAKKGLSYRLLSKAITLASDTIAIDPKTYEVLCNSFAKERVHYIPNPVDTAHEVCDDTSHRVLFLGNVLASKGVEELLQAWHRIAADYPDWTLMIAGFCEEEYKAHLEQQYDMTRVDLCGFAAHDRAMELLATSSFLVLPSYTEGFPNVILEAMMREKAVVATDVGAIADMLSGDCGVVIRPKQVEELATAMTRLMDDPAYRDKLGQNGKHKATAQYATAVVVDQYAALWKGHDLA